MFLRFFVDKPIAIKKHTENTMYKILGSKINPNKKINTMPTIKRTNLRDIPSRKKTKKNDENTKAVPKSPWIKINNEGNAITIETYIKFFKDFKFKLYESKIFANNNAVENLENSDGWNLKPKTENQDLDAETSTPTNKTTIKSRMDKIYRGTAKL